MEVYYPAIPYRIFFLYIEPISALLGAFYAAFKPVTYLQLLSSSIAGNSTSLPTPVTSSLYQLANLYLLFAVNEHLVLSSSTSLHTWRTLLFGLLVADFGHLATMIPVAREKGFEQVFVKFWEWNAMEWGSVGFVYSGACMRLSFLLLTSGWWRNRSTDRKRKQD
ncbi:hypothetical protein BDW22DRAFT_1338939 [Trametopsis cervina]|nr:hypothetical protein BDW22DRAFT_1338939 [Trametopsis cervina]